MFIKSFLLILPGHGSKSATPESKRTASVRSSHGSSASPTTPNQPPPTAPKAVTTGTLRVRAKNQPPPSAPPPPPEVPKVPNGPPPPVLPNVAPPPPPMGNAPGSPIDLPPPPPPPPMPADLEAMSPEPPPPPPMTLDVGRKQNPVPGMMGDSMYSNYMMVVIVHSILHPLIYVSAITVLASQNIA